MPVAKKKMFFFAFHTLAPMETPIDTLLPPGCNPHCRACRHRGWTTARSLQQKQDFLRLQLQPWAHRLQTIVSAHPDHRLGYRSNTCLAARYHNGQWHFGTRRRDELIAIPHCPVHHPRVNQSLQALARHLPPELPLAYVAQSGSHCILVIKSRPAAEHPWFVPELASSLQAAGTQALWLHYHPSAGHKVYGKGGWILLWGPKRSYDTRQLRYGPASFQQQIPGIHQASLLQADQFLHAQAHNLVVDLYCGIGASLRQWSTRGATTIGVELSGEAVECALHNAPQSLVLRGTCRQRIPQLESFRLQHPLHKPLLYTNPPRAGMEAEVLQWIAHQLKPQRIAYLSCSPASLARDISYLTQHHYHPTQLTPYDFFPQTHHVECLALLERGD